MEFIDEKNHHINTKKTCVTSGSEHESSIITIMNRKVKWQNVWPTSTDLVTSFTRQMADIYVQCIFFIITMAFLYHVYFSPHFRQINFTKHVFSIGPWDILSIRRIFIFPAYINILTIKLAVCWPVQSGVDQAHFWSVLSLSLTSSIGIHVDFFIHRWYILKRDTCTWLNIWTCFERSRINPFFCL